MLVLAAAAAPFIHGETPLWPVGALWAAVPVHRFAKWWRGGAGASGGGGGGAAAAPFHVVPEDVWGKRVMRAGAPWCNASGGGGEWAWCGAPLSFFEREHFTLGELWPARRVRFYDLRLPVPNQPWAVLERAFGARCRHIARLDEHGGVEADTRAREHARLRRPASVRTLGARQRLRERWAWLMQHASHAH